MPMKRRYRLRHPQDFARLRAEGQVTRHPMLSLSVAPNQQAHNRYGIITPKRLGNAVRRNQTRRRIAEALRVAHPQLQMGFDVVVIARTKVVGVPFATVQAAVMQTLQRADLLSEGEHT